MFVMHNLASVSLYSLELRSNVLLALCCASTSSVFCDIITVLWTFTRMSDAFHQPKVVATCDSCVGPVPERYTTTHGQVRSTTTFTYKEEWSAEKARRITMRSKQDEAESTCRCRSK